MLSKKRMKEKERERGREERRKKENLKSFKSGVNIGTVKGKNV